MTDYEKMLAEEMERKTNDLYNRIEQMLRISRKYLSHSIMMELLDAAYPSSKEKRHEDDEA